MNQKNNLPKSPDPTEILIDIDGIYGQKENKPGSSILDDPKNFSEFDPLSDDFATNQDKIPSFQPSNLKPQSPELFSENLDSDAQITFSQNIKSKASNRVYKVSHRHRFSEADLPQNINSAKSGDLSFFDPISPKRGEPEKVFNQNDIEEIKECLESHLCNNDSSLFSESSTDKIEYSGFSSSEISNLCSDSFPDKIFDSVDNEDYNESVNYSDDEEHVSVGRFQIRKVSHLFDQQSQKRRKTHFNISRLTIGNSSTLNHLPTIMEDSDEEVSINSNTNVSRASTSRRIDQNNPIAVNFLSPNPTKINPVGSKFKIHITHHADSILS